MIWYCYIPDEGDWKINYSGTDKTEATAAYLAWAGLSVLPDGYIIWAA